MNPKVSIIIPMYNVEKYIEKCIESVINQTYKNLEIILVNDGSPDNCKGIAKHYSKFDNRIKVINKNNGGLSDARNAGLKIVTGDYVCFVDSDDYIELNTIEVLINSEGTLNPDVIVFSYFNEKVDFNESIISKTPVQLDVENLESMTSIIGYAWNKLYKTSLIKDCNISFIKGLSLVEDIVFNENIFLNAEKIHYLNKPLYHYIDRKRSSLIKQYHEKSFDLQKMGYKSRENVMKKLFGENKDIKKTLANAYITGIRYCLANLFFYKNNLGIKDKYKLVKLMLSEEETRHQVSNYVPVTFQDKLIKFYVFYKFPFLLTVSYNFRFFISKMKAGG